MPRGYIHVYDHHFQRFSSLKPIDELKPNLVCSITDSSSDDNQADIIEAFNPTCRYLDDLLKIDNPFFLGMVNQIYPPELQLNKVNTSGTDAPLLDLYLSSLMVLFSSKFMISVMTLILIL